MQRSACLCLSNAGIKGAGYHPQLLNLKKNYSIWVWVYAKEPRCWQRPEVLGSLELETQVVVSCPVLALGLIQGPL